MGRSFLSVKLAAVFGLLVAGAVAAQQQLAASNAEVVTERVHIVSDCDEHVSALVHTPRARATGSQAVGAART